MVYGQNRGSATAARTSDKAQAYYHFSMGHLYAELAGMYANRGQYFSKAIEHYRAAMKADPSADFLVEELADLYIQSGRLREGVTDAENMLKENPGNLNARRILGRIYTRLIGDTRQDRVQDEMLKRAIEQYSKITELVPKDKESWLRLGWLQKVAHNSTESLRAYNTVLELDPENEDALTGLAMVYSDLGDSQGAIEALEKVTSKSPTLNTLTALASAYEQIRDYQNAATVLERAMELAPNNPEIKRAYGQTLLYADETGKAEKVFEELAAGDPKNALFQLRLSQIYRQQRQFDKARAASERAKALDPNNLEVLYNEVNLLESEGQVAEAAERLKSIIDASQRDTYSTQDRSNRALLLERLGLLYRAQESYEDAVSTFRQLSELDPTLAPRAAAQIVDTYRVAKNFDKAVAEAEAARQQYPDDGTLRLVRASVLADVGRANEAAADLKGLLGGENDREMYLQIAQVQQKGKNFSEAQKALDEAEKLSQSKEELESVHFLRGAVQERMEDFEGAEESFRKVLELNPENASALNYLGYMLADRNVRLQEAEQHIKKALELEPGNGAYLDSLGWVYYRMDRLDEAEEHLQRALQKVSGDPVVNDHLGDVYFRQGKLKEAIAQWQAALKEWDHSSAAEKDEQAVAKIEKKLEGAKIRLAKESGSPTPKRQ